MPKIETESVHTSAADGKRTVLEAEALEALGCLTLLIRNMKDVYDIKAADWIIRKPPFQKAEAIVKNNRGGS